MVLAAAGEARGGRVPMAAERALATKAWGVLGAALATGEVARPRELFPTEAVRSLVEDLGLVRTRDPAAVWYRSRRASIAERLLLTKRKMEEVREALVNSTTNMPKSTVSSAKSGFQHGASKSITGSPRNLPMTPPAVSKQSLLNGTVAGASSIKPPNIPSTFSVPPVGTSDIKMVIDVNGPNFTQSGGAETIGVEHLNSPGHHTADSTNQNSVQSSNQAEKFLGKKAPAICPMTESVIMGYQAPRRESIFSNHKAIAKHVGQVLDQPVNHTSWSVPSTEYMNTRLDCQICKVPIADMESLLVCDACERGMHLICLQYYGNQHVPNTEWYCPSCVLHSKGKALPPKYGKVTRTIVAPNIGVTQPSSQVAAENQTKKDDSKKVVANESAINQRPNEVGIALHKSGPMALDKPLSISGAGPQKENVKHDEISSIEKEGNAHPCGILADTAKFCNEVQSTGASSCGSGNLSGGSHMHIESSSVSSVYDSTLQSTTLSRLKHLIHSCSVSFVENCESTRASYQNPSKNVQMTSIRTLTDEIHQTDGVIKNGIGKLHKQETADCAISDHGNVQQVTLNEHISSKLGIIEDHKGGYVGCDTDSIVDWVGGALKSVDGKTYYNSCNIDGIMYNLHDHVLIASEVSKSCPCKLQSLWEEDDSGSRMAMVNPYFMGSDIPTCISKPCDIPTDEKNEVYGSNNEIIVLVSAICGPCEVLLHADKFREETMRRCHSDSSVSRFHPIFFCRWKYDESTSCFYKDYNVDSFMGS